MSSNRMGTIGDDAPQALPDVHGAEGSLDDGLDSGFKPMTAAQASEWRARQPAPLSPWAVLGAQAVAAILAVALCALLSGGQRVAVTSAAYGAAAAWLPALLFARMVARRMRLSANAGGALLALMVWEGIKVLLTILLLLLAQRVLGQVSWLALLAGFVVTVKAAWVALWRMSAGLPRKPSV